MYFNIETDIKQNKKINWLRKYIAPTPSDICIIYCLWSVVVIYHQQTFLFPLLDGSPHYVRCHKYRCKNEA